MTGRAYRGKKTMADADLGNEAGAAPGDEGMPVVYDDRPSPNAPIEERQAWILEHRGPGVFSDEVLEEMRERYCALPGCTSTAKRGSLFCPYHHGTALGEAGARELRQLNREMERLARTTDRDDRKLAIAKFNARVERGDFALLFARKTQETLEQAADDIALDLELGALRLALARAIQEIEDPKEMSLAISRLSNAAVRASWANVEMRKIRRYRK